MLCNFRTPLSRVLLKLSLPKQLKAVAQIFVTAFIRRESTKSQWRRTSKRRCVNNFSRVWLFHYLLYWEVWSDLFKDGHAGIVYNVLSVPLAFFSCVSVLCKCVPWRSKNQTIELREIRKSSSYVITHQDRMSLHKMRMWTPQMTT